ncbi:unnamed protein product [Camellia sinensis]
MVLANMKRVSDLHNLNCKGSVFITTHHNISGHHLIEFLMAKWGLKCTKLLDDFSFMPSYKAFGLSGNIQLAEIVLNNEEVMCQKLAVKS